MAQRVGILNGYNQLQDKDIGTLIGALSSAQGFIVSGLAVTSGAVGAGKALIKCTRTSTSPSEDVWVVFENTASVAIDTTGTKKVYIQITQANINDATLNTDLSGLNIGSIATGASYPSSNYIPLASITGGVITDERPVTTINSHYVDGLLKLKKSTNIASASTTDLATLTGNFAHVTGTTTITSFGGSSLPTGTPIYLVFDGALTLTHNGTSLILPGSANITTASGDTAYLIHEGSGNWRCVHYQKASGQPVVTVVANIPGEIRIWPTSVAPSGWFICDGSAVSRTTYASLFSAIGTTYGAGDGSSTFNLPNLKGRVVVGLDSGQTEFDAIAEVGGAKTHTLSASEIPAHTHGVTAPGDGGAGALVSTWRVSNAGSNRTVTSDANTGGGAHNNLQPYMVMNYIIAR